MITRCETRGDCWTSIGSPGIVREPRFEGYSEIPGQRVIQLERTQKKTICGCCGTVHRSFYDKKVRRIRDLFLWRRPDLSGGGGAARPMPEVWESKAREAELACEQSLLHETVWDLCGAEVPSDDGAGCSEGIEIGLAYGKGFGQGIHGGAASAEPCCRAWRDRGRRIALRKGHRYRIVVSDLGRGRPIWYGGKDRSEESMEWVLPMAGRQEGQEDSVGRDGHVEGL